LAAVLGYGLDNQVIVIQFAAWTGVFLSLYSIPPGYDDQLWNSNVYLGLSAHGQGRQGMKLTTNLQLMPNLRIFAEL
jgi:hypothetical protein